MQSRKMSAIESAANLVLGYVISVLLLYTIMPLYGYYPDFSTSNQMVLWFTVVSLIRSYGLRRLFNFIQVSLDNRKMKNDIMEIDRTKDLSGLIKITKESLDNENIEGKYLVRISLEIKERRSVAFFFIDRIREVFGSRFEIETQNSNEIIIAIYYISSLNHELIEEKINKYQRLIDLVSDGDFKSYEEIITKSFKLDLTPKI